MPRFCSVAPSVLSGMLALAAKLGEVRGLKAQQPTEEFRERVRMENARGALALDGCVLAMEQVTAVVRSWPVFIDREVQVKCAFLVGAFGRAGRGARDPWSMAEFVETSPDGLRTGQFVVRRGARFSYVVPPAEQVEGLLRYFFAGVGPEAEPPLLTGCRMVYEMLLLHPFSRWNSVMACLWQMECLCVYDSLFALLPVTALMYEREEELTEAFAASYAAGDGSIFAEWMLGLLADAVDVLLEHYRGAPKASARLELFREECGGGLFARRDYAAFFKSISVPTASRDLAQGVQAGLLRIRGNGRGTRYAYVKKG